MIMPIRERLIKTVIMVKIRLNDSLNIAVERYYFAKKSAKFNTDFFNTSFLI